MTSSHLMRRWALPALAAVAVSFPAPAVAEGAPATETVITRHFSKSVELRDTPPCIGTVTYDVHETFHITEFPNGVVHVTNNQSGEATFASAVDGRLYTGAFSGTFNVQANQATFTNSSTYNLRVKAPDGSTVRFWITAHQTFNRFADDPVVELFHVRCSARAGSGVAPN